jgi:hypothetical protein
MSGLSSEKTYDNIILVPFILKAFSIIWTKECFLN